MAPSTNRDKKKQDELLFLSEVLNSRFNLITDFELKNKIINQLIDLPMKKLGERLLKSYLYLLIGNITKSDNLLQEFINKKPFENYQGHGGEFSIHQQLASENIQQILVKLANHPADRKVYHLFAQYLLSYYKNNSLQTLVTDNQGPVLNEQLDLKFTERIAPALVHHLKLMKEGETGKTLRLMNLKDYPLSEQVYWHLPFLDIDPVVTPDLVEELHKIEQADQLWFLYLIDNEKIADAYTRKSGKALLPGRRHFLYEKLDNPETFMLSLFKLVEMGNIDESMIKRTIDFITHD